MAIGSQELVEFLYKLYQENRVILIRGNHEDLFDEMKERGKPKNHDYSNGTIRSLGDLHQPAKWSETLAYALFDEAITQYNPHWDILRNSMLNYYETKNYIFVHGWIPVKEETRPDKKVLHFYDPNWRNATQEEWHEARWLNGMFMASLGIIEKNKTIVCGHWHTSWGHVRENPENKGKSARELSRLEFSKKDQFGIYRSDGVIGLDACTTFTGYCNCLKLTEKEI